MKIYNKKSLSHKELKTKKSHFPLLRNEKTNKVDGWRKTE